MFGMPGANRLLPLCALVYKHQLHGQKETMGFAISNLSANVKVSRSTSFINAMVKEAPLLFNYRRLECVTPKGALRPAVCHASATREGS